MKKAEDLSPHDELDVVSIGFRPSTSVIEWILGSDSLFRSTISNILSNTGLHVSLEINFLKLLISYNLLVFFNLDVSRRGCSALEHRSRSSFVRGSISAAN